MKTFALLLAVCLVGAAVAKPAGSTRGELIDLLKGLLSKGQTVSLVVLCDVQGYLYIRWTPIQLRESIDSGEVFIFSRLN